MSSRFVGVRDDIVEARRPFEAGGKLSLHMSGFRQPAERVCVRARRAELEMQAGRHRQVDDDLHRLPEVEDDGIRGVGRWPKLGRAVGETVADARKMALDSGDLFREDLSIEGAQYGSSARRSA